MDALEHALITLLSCAGLLLVLALPLVLRKVPRNRVYGFRTRATLNDDLLWFEANAYFGRRLVAASLFSVASVWVLYYTALSPELFVYAALGVIVAPALAAALDTFLHVRSLRRRGSAPVSPP
jgi:uncharacterized membrane protein